jgi:hypothetical protein
MLTNWKADTTDIIIANITKKLFMTTLETSIRESDTTRRKTYFHINPNLTISPAIRQKIWHQRSIITELLTRLSSHYLKIETG